MCVNTFFLTLPSFFVKLDLGLKYTKEGNKINNRIFELRKKLELSQEKFGEKLGVTGPGISKIESGDRGVTEQMIMAICRVFYVNEEWLRTGEGEPFKTEDDLYQVIVDNIGQIDDLDRKLLIGYLKLPAEHRQAFKNFILTLIKE